MINYKEVIVIADNNNLYRKAYKIGFLAYFVLFAFSIVFYKERTIFTDIAYHLFYILKDGQLAIQNFRFVAVVTQLFPLIGSKLNLSLNTICILYSIGFILYYFTCYILCGSVLKNYRMAIVLLLFNTLFVTDTFYWIQSELPQGVALMILVFAYIENRPRRKVYADGLLYTGVFTVAFSHPILLFAGVYFVAFQYLRNREDSAQKQLLYAVSIFYVLSIVLKNVFFKTAYDSQGMAHGDKLKELFPNYFMLASNKQFLLYCVEKFYWIPICSIAITVVYARLKKWKELALFIAFTIGYLLVVNVPLSDGKTAAHYIENLYLPLGILIALPLVYDVFPVIEKRKIAVAVLGLIIFTAAIRIYNHNTRYVARLNWERAFLKTHTDGKYMIAEKHTPIDTLIMTWGTPYEFWLLSTIEQGKTASIIISNDINSIKWAAERKDAFVPTWGIEAYNILPSRYFILNDTVNSYTIIE